MDFKIDTKEKMHVIVVNEDFLSANMSEALEITCKSFLNEPIKNVIVNLSKVTKIDSNITQTFLILQECFGEAGASLVFCCIPKSVLKQLEENEVEEMLNITPTESEAWDIVQMEEIEREYLN